MFNMNPFDSLSDCRVMLKLIEGLSNDPLMEWCVLGPILSLGINLYGCPNIYM